MAAMARLLYSLAFICIGNTLVIVEDGYFHICHANVTFSFINTIHDLSVFWVAFYYRFCTSARSSVTL